jgi:hypothetical protein
MKALKALVAAIALAMVATTVAVACGDGPCQKHDELSKAQSKQKDAKAATATKAVKNTKATEVAKATK